ncbi:uncharacterized protein LOC5563873 [Aedes aegypti]|uniref:Uncharacterized protein n=1 Tax=Aedes aegypti TaxID=7159 RepID=A0A1S4G178_AEDAE|nr:odorant receptor 88 [Aedes aegypti]
MDHFRKAATKVRLQYRILKVIYWHYEPDKDYYRLVNIFLAISGIYYTPTKFWHQIAWGLVQAISVCHYFLTLTHFIEALMDWPHLVPIIWNFVEFFMMCTALGKSHVICSHMDSILETQRFVNRRQASSGNAAEDAKAREVLFKIIQTLPGTLIWVVGNVIILAAITIGPDDPLFGQSQLFHRHLSGWKARIAHIIFNSTLFPIWVGKTYCSTILISCLLMGLKTELTLATQKFGSVCDNFEKLGMERFQESLLACIKQQMLILDQLLKLQSLVRFDFLVVYYGALVTIGSLIFIPTTDGLTIGSFILTLGITVFFIESYLWCWLVESFRNINDTIEEKIMDVIVMIPHDPSRHSEYIRLRTQLMIMKIGTRFSAKFNCGGVFDITVEAVGKLLNITYSLVTFLLNFT